MVTDDDTPEGRIPTDTVVGAALRQCFAEGIQAYIVQRGDKHTGLIMVVHHILGKGYRLLLQSRNEDGVMGWMNMLGDTAEDVTPDYTDIYPIVERAKSRDPDLWIVELESKDIAIPFEGTIFE